MKQTTAMQMHESATLNAGHGCANSGHACEIEEEKIDHMSVKQAVGQISKHTGHQQRKRNITPDVARPPKRRRFARCCMRSP